MKRRLQFPFLMILGFIAICCISGCSHPPTGVSVVSHFPDMPLVVGGERGSSDSGGARYETVNGVPEAVPADAPILRAAHIAIVPSSSVTARVSSSSAGNTPDKFFWQGDDEYVVDGKSMNIRMTIDGRVHTFSVGGKSFQLAQGNFFRITIVPGPSIQVIQIPIVDILENDPGKVKAVFSTHP